MSNNSTDATAPNEIGCILDIKAKPVRVAAVLWSSNRGEVVVGETDDGRWYFSEDDNTEIFATPHELADRLCPAEAGTFYADAMNDLGWVMPNWPKLDAVAEDMKTRRTQKLAAADPKPIHKTDTEKVKGAKS